MTRLKTSFSDSDLTDRVRARLEDPSYSINHDHDQDHENVFGYASELFVPKWSIAARIAVSVFGMVGLVLASQTRGSVRKAVGLFGLSSLIRAITNLHVTDLIGWVANPSVRLRRTIRVKALIDDVYGFLSHFENYPRFMSYIQKVEVNNQGDVRWIAQGPAGIVFHWSSTFWKMTLNQAISWKSSVNSLVRTSGDIHLVDLPGEGTEIQIELAYAPPVGALGYAVVHFLGFDPKDKIDEDLQVLKAIIEKDFSSRVDLIEFLAA